jgi:hypothetical protein
MTTVRGVAAGIAVVMLVAAASAGGVNGSKSPEDPIRRFQQAVDAYLVLRASVARTLPPLDLSPDVETLRLASAALAAAIRTARPFAAEGDILNPAAAAVLRRRVRALLDDPACPLAEVLAADSLDDQRPLPPRPIVHDRFDWSRASFMPSCLLRVLPALPDELQYRFVQRDLVLVDIDADLVVDVLTDALPVGESWNGERYAASTFPDRDLTILIA